jgi:uncharacterized protein (TIGR00251 family)
MRVNVIVVPNSKNYEVSKVDEDTYRVRVDARATGGEANARLIEILADYFNAPRYTVRIVKGFKSRNKIVEIDSL